MKHFAALFTALDQTTKTSVKTAALASYFETAPLQDRVWTIAMFTGRRPKRTVTTARLREWAAAQANIPLWLFEDSYAIVGDLAETIALVLPAPQTASDHDLSHWIAFIQALAPLDEDMRKQRILAAWNELGTTERFLFNKLITGGFRVGVSQKLIIRALARVTGRDEPELAHRLMGAWDPAQTDWHTLIEAEDSAIDASRPYPFYLAHALDTDPKELGPVSDWHAEWKWDGIRGQLILRDGQYFVWSRGEDLMTHRFPELARALDFLPQGTVLDGELLAWADNAPLPFNALQKRIGRKTVPKTLLRDAPVILYTYDLLEWNGHDQRDLPLETRLARLTDLFADLPSDAPLRLSPAIKVNGWPDLAQLRATARTENAEGLMLKRKSSPYGVGRKKGDWWKWKLDPLTVDAVMIYAQQGHGRRANLFTDFTFAVWTGNDLVPFTKAYSGLSDDEFRQITAWVKKNTQQRFGPVRQVKPELVFEVAFEGIHESPRHKSGIALRFPRMSRWRHDKTAQDANTLADLRALLDLNNAP